MSYEDLRVRAEAFLAKYHPERTIPVPIEEIAEFKLHLDIFPIRGLRRLLDVDGFLTGNLREIWVDEGVCENYPNRYRFTLAHEVGHLILHSELYGDCPFDSMAGWKEFHNSIADQEHSWFEYQGHAFAGLVLVPRDLLEAECRKCVNMVKRGRIGLKDNWDFAWDYIGAFLAKRFEVSADVIQRRLQKDAIPEQFR